MALAPQLSVDTHPDTDASDPTARRVSRRRDRYAARQILWRESSLKRARYCGKYATGDTVTIRGDKNGAGFGGVQSCGSVWACPVCSEKINAARQSDLEDGITNWLARGGAVLFGTLTMRHNRGHSLEELWDAISPAWQAVTSRSTAWRGGKRQLGDKARFGIAGYVRVVETKHGQHGWHPHVHFLLFLDAPLTLDARTDLRRRLFGRWETALAKRGLSVLESVGIDLRPVDSAAMADYFAKGTYTTASGAAYEVTGSHSKKAGKGGRTPFDLLRSVVEQGDADDLDLWHEWERVSKGRRQLTWSRGLRDLLALGEEVTDEAIVEEEHGGETLVSVTAGDYRMLAARGYLCDVLELAEAGDGGRRLRRYLDGLGCLRPDQFTYRE